MYRVSSQIKILMDSPTKVCVLLISNISFSWNAHRGSDNRTTFNHIRFTMAQTLIGFEIGCGIKSWMIIGLSAGGLS